MPRWKTDPSKETELIRDARESLANLAAFYAAHKHMASMRLAKKAVALLDWIPNSK